MSLQERFTEIEQALRDVASEDAKLNKVRACVYRDGNTLKIGYEVYAYIGNKLCFGSAESPGKAIDEVVDCFNSISKQTSEVVELKEEEAL